MKRQITATYLDEKQLGELESIKQYHGLTSTADTLRMLIRKEHNRIQQNQDKETPNA